MVLIGQTGQARSAWHALLSEHALLVLQQRNGLFEAVLQLYGCVGSVDSNQVARVLSTQCFQHDRLRYSVARCVSTLHGRQKVLCGK